MRKTFGLSCSVITLSNQPQKIFDNIWLQHLEAWNAAAETVNKFKNKDAIVSTDYIYTFDSSFAVAGGLNNDDVDKIGIFVKDFVVQNLLPFMERNVQHWNEQVFSDLIKGR